MRILVLNAGSSSLKASVIDAPGRTVSATEMEWGADASRTTDRESGLRRALDALEAGGAPLDSISAVGHRVVHGGPRFTQPAVIDDAVLRGIADVSELAPLHNDVALETITVARRALPDVAHVACFDTAFHATLPPDGYRYPLPERWFTDWGVRRFGFHGLSVAWSLRRAAELLGRAPEELGLIVAHLGSGCSVTAVWGGRSVDTSMGMTPLEGLMMGTRAGSIDSGIPLELLRRGRLTRDELAAALEHESGLLGVSGVGADFRAVTAAADAGNERAALAVSLFVRRAAAGVGGAATSLPHLDAVVFTGGIGEHAGRARAAIVERLGPLGVPPIAPTEDGRDRVLEQAASNGIAVLRIEAREDLVIADDVERVLAN